MSIPHIGIIGGSGLYKMEGLHSVESVYINTPFGDPSDNFIVGKFEEHTVVFLPRHGVGHKLLPSELNYRANIYGFKKLGVKQIIAVSAVGSLKEEIAPTHLVIPHQFYDRTNRRNCTFFGNGIVGHIPFADPICLNLAKILYEAAKDSEAVVHWGGTYLNMEGPQFSTKAESETYRRWGMDIIGMTNLCEAKLAREAEICYATLAMVTDFDCWHPSHGSVTYEMILNYLTKNIVSAQKIVKNIISLIYKEYKDRKCECHTALKNSIVTDKNLIPDKVKKDLELIIGKYV